MKRYLYVCLAAALALVGSASPARAQASALGNSFAIYAAASRGSSVAYDSKNHVYLVVSAYGAVNGRFVSADGVALSNCVTSGTGFVLGGGAFGHFPRVAFSPDANGGLGGFMVTWHEGDSPSGGNAVHARPVSLSGCLGPNRIISGGDSTWWEGGPAIAYSTGSQRYLVAWRAIASSNGSPNDISGRLLDIGGEPLGAAPLKITDSNVYEDNPSVAYNPAANEFLVTYAGADTTAFVAARRVTPAGALGPAFELTRTGGTYVTDTTYLAATGNYLAVWHQLPGGATGRLVNGTTGAPASGVIPLSSRFTANDAISVAYNAMSGTSFMVSQDQQSYENGGLEISGAGAPGAGFVVTNIGGNGNFYPRIAASSVDRRWMLVTSNIFQRIHGQFITTASNGGGGGGTTPTVPTSPLQVTLTADRATPVAAGTSLTWTATPTGGTQPVQFQFWRYTAGSDWVMVQDYSSKASYTWTPTAGTHGVQVWARNSGSTAKYDTFAATPLFNVIGAAEMTAFSSNLAVPTAPYTSVTWTAQATAGGSPLQYKFWRYTAGAGWTVGQDWTAYNTFSWVLPEGTHAVQAWVRRLGSAAEYEDWAGTTLFTVVGGAAKINDVTANVAFPASPNTSVTWTVSASGGANEYRFWLYDYSQGVWSIFRDWSPSNQATWTPGLQGTGLHVMQAWVRRQGSAAAWEDYRSTPDFNVTASTGFTVAASRPLTGLRFGDVVTWTAQAAGTGPWEYQFWTYDASTGSWTLRQGYNGYNSFSWVPTPGTRAVQVWMRQVGSQARFERYYESGMFVVTP